VLGVRRTYAGYLLAGIAFLATLFIAGIAGFVLLERESLLDATLTTISAISTVGYSPPRPLSAAGKILAIALIGGGLVGTALVISLLTEYFMEGHLLGAWERGRVERALGRLRDHYIIVGFGRVGREVARQLSSAQDDFVVLDASEGALEAARDLGYVYHRGDPSHDEILRAVGVERARGLIACADSDVMNVYVTLTARTLSRNVFIIARAAQPDAEPKLYNAGADRVVSPYIMAGRHIAQMAAQPRLADTLDLLFDGQQIGVRILELRGDDLPGLAERTVREAHHTVLQGAFVLAVDRDGERLEHVGPDEVIRASDRLLVVGSGAELDKLATIK
jgi:voltage-gated potassium channel